MQSHVITAKPLNSLGPNGHLGLRKGYAKYPHSIYIRTVCPVKRLSTFNFPAMAPGSTGSTIHVQRPLTFFRRAWKQPVMPGTMAVSSTASSTSSRGPSPLRPGFGMTASYRPENPEVADEHHPVIHAGRVAVITGTCLPRYLKDSADQLICRCGFWDWTCSRERTGKVRALP
jgi:hypothetical protein